MREVELIMMRAGTHRILVATIGLCAVLGTACSLIIEHRSKQCSADADCAGFTSAVCDTLQGVCVPRSGEQCLDPSGCWACAPKNTKEFQSACTDAACVPYDNGALEALLTADGGVPPIP
jgi:hypothetical protein